MLKLVMLLNTFLALFGYEPVSKRGFKAWLKLAKAIISLLSGNDLPLSTLCVPLKHASPYTHIRMIGCVISILIHLRVIELGYTPKGYPLLKLNPLFGGDNTTEKGIRIPKSKPVSRKGVLGNEDVLECLSYPVIMMGMDTHKDMVRKSPNAEAYWSAVDFIHSKYQGRPMFIPYYWDFRGRLYARTDAFNFTSDKTCRSYMTIDGRQTDAWDTKASGPLLISLMFRDNHALVELFGLTKEGIRTKDIDPYMSIASHIPQSILDSLPTIDENTTTVRLKIKDCTIQYSYCGDATVKRYFGDAFDAYSTAYAKVMPKGAEFRHATINGWNETVSEYNWDMPDGFHVCMPVLKGMYTGYERNPTRVVLKDLSGKVIASAICKYTVQQPIAKKQSGSLGLGANMVHSTDAYLLRELIRRCKNQFKCSPYFLKSGELSTDSESACKIYECYKNTGLVSLNILNYVKPGDTLPEEYLNKVMGIYKTLPKVGFNIRPVHDEFGIHPEHKETLVSQFNMLLSEIYCSNLAEYFMSTQVKGYSVTPGKKDDKVIQAILNNNYLLHKE